MPTYSDAPLPVGLDSLVGMGMNRVKIAIVVALAQHGGSLTTRELVAALGGEVANTTIARNLQELEDYGYVTGDLPPDGRRRRRTVWKLHHAHLHADLRALIQATTPTALPGRVVLANANSTARPVETKTPI